MYPDIDQYVNALSNYLGLLKQVHVKNEWLNQKLSKADRDLFDYVIGEELDKVGWLACTDSCTNALRVLAEDIGIDVSVNAGRVVRNSPITATGTFEYMKFLNVLNTVCDRFKREYCPEG